MEAPLPDDEIERLAALHDHAILDTAPEEEFNDLVRLAAHVCGVPIAAVSLIDGHRQWFKASVGLNDTETPRDIAFCAYTILQPDILIVPDAEADPRFADNSLVTGDPRIRFYAGMPLVTEDGYALGSLCVIDRKPRVLTPMQEETLRLLARQVASQLKAARRVAEREQLVAEKERLATERLEIEADRLRLAAIVETCEDAIYSMTLDATITSWNRGAEYLYGYTAAEIIGQRVDMFVPAERRAELRHILHTIHLGEDLNPLETVRLTKTGTVVDVSLRCSPVLGRNGNVIGASMIARNITQRKHTEAALRAEREFTHALLESLQEGIVACDAQGTLTLLNRTMREMHDLPEQSLSPEQWAEHFDLYEADGVTPMRAQDVPLFRALQGEAIRETELVVAPKFGSSRTLIANGKAIYSAGGEKLGAVVALHDVTERRRAEGEIARLAAIVESSEEAILAATLDGTILSWNRGAERLYGYAAAEMVGRHVSILTPPDQKSPVPAVVTRLLRGEPLMPIEVLRTRRDGTSFHAALSFSPIKDTTGHIVGISCIARDITTRKQAEEALAESEARLRRLTDAAFEGIGMSQDGVILDVSPTFAALFGYDTPTAMVGIASVDLAAPESRSVAVRKVAENDEEPYEATLMRRDGTTFQAEIQARKIQIDGRPARVTAIRDITARKQMEEALAESEARLRRLMDAAFEGVAVGQEGALVDVSPAFAALFGYNTPAEMIGLAGLEMVAPESRALVTRKVADADEEPYEATLQRRDGTTFQAEVRGRLIQLGGRPARATVVRDITERKAMEDALAESEARLRRLTDAAFEGVVMMQDGIIVEVSQAWATLFGFDTPAAAIGVLAAALVAPESFELVAQKIAEGNEEFYEATLLRRDGTTFQAEMRGRSIQIGGCPARITAVRDITERKRMESALLESEARFRTSVDAMEEGMALQAADGTILMCNASAERILGLTADQMAGRTSLDPRWRSVREDGTDFPGDQHPAMVALREGTSQRNIVMGVHKPSGELTWVSINAVPLLSTGQEDAGTKAAMRGVVVTFSDITERRLQEVTLHESHVALQDSRGRLNEAQRVAKIGSWEYDLDTGLVTWSEELFRLFGMEPAAEAPDYEKAVALYHPEDALILDASVTRAAQEGIGYALDLRGNPARQAKGIARWYHAIGTPVYDASGRVVRLTGTLADITYRKRLELAQREYAERLRQKEATLRALLESAPVILYTTDAEGIITLVEGTGLAELGLTAGEVLGRSMFEFTGGFSEVEANMRRALAGEVASYDMRFGDAWLHMEMQPMRDVDDTVTGIIGVSFNVTERVASEERFRVLFEQSSHAHVLFDEEGGIMDCNTVTLSMMRCADKAQLMGIHPALLSPEFQPDGRRSDEKGAEMCALARSSGSHRFEWQRRAADGYEYPVEVTLTPVTLGDKPVLLSVWHDLTERKQAEEQVWDYSILLEFQKSELEKSNAELEEANAQLEELATTDGLTGLKNHRAFQERLAEEVSRAARYGTPLSLVLLDVDKFKSYNDSHGHPAGDAVLKAVALVLQGCARDTDVVARYGGEEFVLILPQTDLEGAMAFAERLRAAVECHPWPVRAVTASFGVAGLRLAEEGGAELVACADAALYRSKEGGRNRVTCDGVDETAPETLKAETLKDTEAIFVSDPNGIFLQVSARACELLGYTEADLIGTISKDLIHPDDLAYLGWRMDDVMLGQKVVTERRLRCKDGTWLRAELHTQRREDGRAECILCKIARIEGRQSSLGGNYLLQEASEGFSMLDALVAAVDNKDRYTRRHSEDVMVYGLMIARELGLDAAAQDTVAVAALLHDVGKIGVPDAILRKPGSLTKAEFEAVKSHPQMGAAIVSTVSELSAILGAVRHHHERWDGEGYPFGLRGEEIPFLARLMAVADAFSAMTTDRPYRAGMPPEQALAMLAAGAGTQWDPHCVGAFQRAYAQSSETASP